MKPLLPSRQFATHAHCCFSAGCCPAIRWWRTMEISHSVKERTISENSLVLLLQGLHGHVTTVELRDESMAVGRITNVDAFMNVRLAEATFTDRCGRSSWLDDLFVTGRNVRYVHIPDDVDIRTTIEKQLQLIHRVRTFGGRDKGRKEFLKQGDK
ncbi:U7 snRNA-associated Sm-like protein LSm10 isoform X1 [Rhineura floridana]|uniref:U7 snRNA-associated Sm-like protein LSm10 isoform X1 n=2 Tax=Rhineura floridana TaxID=261503 RepID=UPI002AC83FEE|nr:U7 snRNA-associated Sm-like protein LSm10 isoform X1 [Rhineura floridana]